jgi:DNA-binding transcriptional LysR family regulator
LEPTARALELWPSVREALRALQASLSPATFEPASAENAFVLTMADATAAELMPALVRQIGEEAPSVTLRVVPLTTRDPRRLLDEGEAGLAIGHFPAALADMTAKAQAGDNVAFHHHRLFAGDYVCVMRKNHPLASGPLTLNKFCAARHMLVSFSGRAFGFVDEALALLGRTRFVALTVNQFFTAGKVVANSDLLTVLPRHFISVTGFEDQLAQRDLPFEVPRIHVDALWHQRVDGIASHAWLREKIEVLANKAFPA